VDKRNDRSPTRDGRLFPKTRKIWKAVSAMVAVSVAQPDVTLVLDNDGVINDATLANSISGEGVAGWIGRPWFETVGEVGSDRVRRMIADARATGISAFGQVNQRFPSGRELPIEYAAARVAGRAGLVAIGKNLQSVAELQSQLVAAQQAREQEYWKLREVETRYRLLFDTSNQAVVIVRADTLRIAEVNMAAIRSLGLAQGGEMLAEMAAGDHDKLRTMLDRVREHGRAPSILVHVGPTRSTFTVRASLLTTEPGSSYLLQFEPVRTRVPTGKDNGTPPLAGLIERMPDGYVVLDQEGVVRRANRAFLDLTQTAVEASVIGKRLGNWLAVPGAEATLLSGVQRHRAVRLFPATLEGELGTEIAVEITAVGDRDASPGFYGVLMRDVTRRQSQVAQEAPRAPANDLGAALGLVSEGLGSASMPMMVRDTVEAVERHCITEALGRVRGNRSAAAELLGISRQSLYAKLDRYSLDGETEEGG
jgi:transcriptional regulator PpsR